MTPGKLWVSEIFRSIQGEGPYIGSPATFIRTAYCNLHCITCDAWYTWDHRRIVVKDDARLMPLARIAEEMYRDPLVVITGGEPLLQHDALWVLLNRSWIYDRTTIQFETNGTRPPGSLAMLPIVWVVSPKIGAFGQCDPLPRRIVPDVLKSFNRNQHVWYKFVVTHESDVKGILELVRTLRLREDRIFLMPEGRSAATLNARAQWLVERCKELGWRYSDRLHIRLYGDKRGT